MNLAQHHREVNKADVGPRHSAFRVGPEREGWVLLKIPRGDVDGVGEVRRLTLDPGQFVLGSRSYVQTETSKSLVFVMQHGSSN